MTNECIGALKSLGIDIYGSAEPIFVHIIMNKFDEKANVNLNIDLLATMANALSNVLFVMKIFFLYKCVKYSK